MPQKILIVQTAFPGDVILATALLESLRRDLPESKLDILVRKGNETLFHSHPFVGHVFVWEKSKHKWRNLFSLLTEIRKEKYDLLINLQRFASSGILTVLSGASETRGFIKNPLSNFFSKKYPHTIGDGQHEIERNHTLISDLTKGKTALPRLYPSPSDTEMVGKLKTNSYICIAPGSVWFTKTFPKAKWIEFIKSYRNKYPSEIIYLLGSQSEVELSDSIVLECANDGVINLSGKLSFLQSAALMKDAKMNFVNDSAPMHLASSMNAKTTAVYCSTIPAFGFGPLAERSIIIETEEKLDCRPCGLHGFNKCPEGHFKCAQEIKVQRLIP